jgi:hypothetical protein
MPLTVSRVPERYVYLHADAWRRSYGRNFAAASGAGAPRLFSAVIMVGSLVRAQRGEDLPQRVQLARLQAEQLHYRTIYCVAHLLASDWGHRDLGAWFDWRTWQRAAEYIVQLGCRDELLGLDLEAYWNTEPRYPEPTVLNRAALLVAMRPLLDVLRARRLRPLVRPGKPGFLAAELLATQVQLAGGMGDDYGLSCNEDNRSLIEQLRAANRAALNCEFVEGFYGHYLRDPARRACWTRWPATTGYTSADTRWTRRRCSGRRNG